MELVHFFGVCVQTNCFYSSEWMHLAKTWSFGIHMHWIFEFWFCAIHMRFNESDSSVRVVRMVEKTIRFFFYHRTFCTIWNRFDEGEKKQWEKDSQQIKTEENEKNTSKAHTHVYFLITHCCRMETFSNRNCFASYFLYKFPCDF